MDGRKGEGREEGRGIKAIFILAKLFAATVSIPFSCFLPRWSRGVMNKSGTINECLETERYYPFLRKQCRSFFHLTRRQKLFISPSKESSTRRAEGLKRVKRVREGDRTAGEREVGGERRRNGYREEGIGGGKGGGERRRRSTTRAKLVSRMNEGTKTTTTTTTTTTIGTTTTTTTRTITGG